MKSEYVKKDLPDTQGPFDEKTKENIRRYVDQGSEAIDSRIQELDSSWDAERALQLNIAILAIGSFLLYKSNKRWLIITVIVSVFLAQNAVQGSCAPLKLLRFFGIRSRKEIDREKYALKALRGDFENIKHDIEKAWEAVKEKENEKKPIGFIKTT
jgi:hypothetical protein